MLRCAALAGYRAQAACNLRNPLHPPHRIGGIGCAKGTPLQVALDQEVQPKKIGQPIHGRIVNPCTRSTTSLIPVGSEVTGHVTRIEGLTRGKRTLAALDADFTPTRKIESPSTSCCSRTAAIWPLEPP